MPSPKSGLVPKRDTRATGVEQPLNTRSMPKALLQASGKHGARDLTKPETAKRPQAMRTKSGPVADKPQETPADKKVLQLEQGKDESKEAAFARYLLQPNINSVESMHSFQPLATQADSTGMLQEFRKVADQVSAGDLSSHEAILSNNAIVLDNMFHNLARRAVRNMDGGYTTAAEIYLRMALKAQSQCRTTIEALGELKFPKSATFIKQANIANQQQVNNGHQPGPAPAHEKDITPTNELLTENRSEALDFGGARAAGRANTGLEAVGKIDRTGERGGQSRVGQKRD